MADIKIGFFQPIRRVSVDPTISLTTLFNVVDHLISSPFASKCAYVTQAPQTGLTNKKVFHIKPYDNLPLDRLGHVLVKIICVACFFFSWQAASFLTAVALLIKGYARSTELYTLQPHQKPLQQKHRELTPDEKESIHRWKQKVILQLLFQCFVLGCTEIDAINAPPETMLSVKIGQEACQYPRPFLMEIPFFSAYLRWPSTNELILSEEFPITHTQLKRLSEIYAEAAPIPQDEQLDYEALCLDERAFVLKRAFSSKDSVGRLKIIQSEFGFDSEYMQLYFPQSLPSNYETLPPTNKMPACLFNLLPPRLTVEKANRSENTTERQQNVISCLNDLANQPPPDRYYYSNKVFNEFILSLSEDINKLRNSSRNQNLLPSWDPWQMLEEVLNQCKGVQDYITILDFPPTFSFDERAWQFLKKFPNLYWLQINSPQGITPTNNTYPSVRVVGIDTVPTLPEDAIRKIFPNVEICEIE